MKWIDVNKKLPKVGEKVLVCLSAENILMGRLYENGWACFYTDGENMCVLNTPTHWTNLPRLPKQSKH